MSNRVTVDDLIGKIVLEGRNSFKFIKGHFTEAFQNGYWLLLDEINLESDAVLQAIESAIDSGVLIFNDTSTSEGQGLVVPRHPEFRLFGTQNPNTGFFKGKRESLSKSFLTRFVPVVFKELPRSEWEEVVTCLLTVAHIPDAAAWAVGIVGFHCAVAEEALSFERAGYAEVSIRELLKFVNHMVWYRRAEPTQWPLGESYRADLLRKRVVGFIAWCVYGARFRATGQGFVRALISSPKVGWWDSSAATIEWDVNDSEVVIGGVSVPRTRVDYPERIRQAWLALRSDVPLKPSWFEIACATLSCFVALAWQRSFISENGVYCVTASWALEPLQHTGLVKGGDAGFREVCLASLLLRLRSQRARELVYERLNTAGMPVLPALLSKFSFLQGLAGSSCPFAVTPRVLRVWHAVALGLHVADPILVLGEAGCGKTECMRVLCALLGFSYHQVCLTSESEPQELVGQLNPDEGSSENLVDWYDGAVTHAYRRGDWCILENINEADACVLERLNPLLENPSEWTLSERGDTESVTPGPGFRAIGTMAIGSSPSSSKELSPALFNRFSSVVMEPLPWLQDAASDHGKSEFVSELLAIASVVSVSDEAVLRKAVGVFWDIWSQFKSSGSKRHVTLRTFVRTLDCIYKISMKFPDIKKPTDLIAGAVFVAIRGQLSDQASRDTLDASMKKKFSPSCYDAVKEALKSHFTGTNDHVLTDSREEHAMYVTACILFNYGALLEGPAGKQSRQLC